MAKQLKQPLASVNFKLPNGVSLIAEAYYRMIRSSSRVDAKNIGIDWSTLYVSLELDTGKSLNPQLIQTVDIMWQDGFREWIGEADSVAVALGSATYAKLIIDSIISAIEQVQKAKLD